MRSLRMSLIWPVALAAGCIFDRGGGGEEEPVEAADGERCEAGSDCRSGNCQDFVCRASACECSGDECPEGGEVVSGCNEGWVCLAKYSPGGIFDDPDYYDQCTPLCGACPVYATCEEGATYCSDKPGWSTPVVTVHGPQGVVRMGEMATFHAMASSPIDEPISAIRWRFGGVEVEGGVDVTYTIPNDDSYSDETLSVQATAIDAVGREGYGYLAVPVCGVQGRLCGLFRPPCCGGLTCANDVCE